MGATRAGFYVAWRGMACEWLVDCLCFSLSASEVPKGAVRRCGGEPCVNFEYRISLLEPSTLVHMLHHQGLVPHNLIGGGVLGAGSCYPNSAHAIALSGKRRREIAWVRHRPNAERRHERLHPLLALLHEAALLLLHLVAHAREEEERGRGLVSTTSCGSSPRLRSCLQEKRL